MTRTTSRTRGAAVALTLVAGLTPEAIASVKQPLVALYDEFSPFLATSEWLERNVPACTAEIIPAAKHLALVENTAGFTDAVKRYLQQLSVSPSV